MKKKILFIVNLDSFFLSHRIDVALGALKDGYEVHLATVFTDYKNQLKKYGFKLHPVSMSRAGQGMLENIKSYLSIYALLKNVKPDLVHAIGMKPLIISGIALRICKISSVVFSITGLGYVFLSEGFISQVRRFFVINLLKFCFNQNNFTAIVQNKDDLDLMIKASNLNIKKTVLIKGSGVSLKKYKVKVNTVQKKIPTILFASRLLADKGINEFVAAAKIIKSRMAAKFIVAGAIDYENPSRIKINTIKDWVKTNIITYLGYKKDIRGTIHQSDIIVLPSYGEGFPKILIEAAACGKAIVTTDVSGCRDAIIPGITGLLVQKKNTEELVAAIFFLINNKKKYTSMCKKARKFAEDSFDVTSVVTKHLSIYRKLYNSKNNV